MALRKKPHNIGFAVCALERNAGGRAQIFPDGVFRAVDGRPAKLPGWFVKDHAALLAGAAARTNEFVVDYEHQTLNAERNGQPAPAAGWFSGKDLSHIPGEGIFTEVRWTERAKSYIENDEYRYISPVFKFNPSTGEITELLHIALVNTPALDGMSPAALSYLQGEPRMNEALLELLGLSKDAGEDDVLAALKEKLAEPKPAAPQTAEPDPKRYIEISALKELSDELAALKAKQSADEVAALVAANHKKLPTQKMRDWAGKLTVSALKEFLADAPEMPALDGGTQSGGAAPGGSAGTEDAWKAEFAASAALKTEFGDETLYITYKRAEAGGRI